MIVMEYEGKSPIVWNVFPSYLENNPAIIVSTLSFSYFY